MKRRRTSGFTLIEALVALAVLSALLPVLIKAISLSLRAHEHARRQAIAASLCQDRLNAFVSGLEAVQAKVEGGFGDEHPDFRWSAETNGRSDLELDQLSVRVTWRERGRDYAVEMATLMPETEQ